MSNLNFIKNLVLCLLFSLFTLSSYAQIWKWGRQAKIASPSSFGEGQFITTDKQGNVYNTGFFGDTITFGTYNLKNNGVNFDAYLVKYDSMGNVQWANQSNVPTGSSQAHGMALCVDNIENVFLLGYFNDTVSFSSFQLNTGFSKSSSVDMFLVKYDPNGNALWVKQSIGLSNKSDVFGNSITTDSAGNIYITGSFLDTVSFGSYTLGTQSNSCLFVAKYDPNGNILWAKQAINNFTGECVGSYITADAYGNLYVTGAFTGSLSIGSNVISSSKGDALLAKYDINGNELWVKTANSINCPNGATGLSVATDQSGAIYMTGVFSDTILFNSTRLITASFYSDFFLVKYDGNGNLIWAQSADIFDNSEWVSHSVSVANANVYLAGTGGNGLSSIGFGSDTFSISNPSNDGSSVILKFDTSGKVLCGSMIPGGGDNQNSMAVDPLGKCIYLGSDLFNTIPFGQDTLFMEANETPFVARWQGCIANVISYNKTCSNSCSGMAQVIPIAGVPPYQYLWSTSPVQSTQIAINLCTDSTYFVTIIDAAGNKEKQAFIIQPPSFSPNIKVCCDTSVSAGAIVTLNVSPIIIGDKYLWTPLSGLHCDTCPSTTVIPNMSTTYFVTVTDSGGCSVSQSIKIELICNQLFVPDAFSPNGDGQNDYLYVRGDCIKVMQFDVFDRWGNKVFETTNQNIPWDGRYRGEPMNTGTYEYYLTATLYNGTTQTKKGNITLVR